MTDKPIITKKTILGIAVEAIQSKIASHFEGYSSPLTPLVNEVVEEHREELKAIVDQCLTSTIGDKDFKAAIRHEFKHKVAKSLVGKLEGAVEKAADSLRQDPTTRAKIILAIEELIKTPSN
jgi:hypothetical protein